MAQQWATGGIHVFAAPLSGGQPVYFGTAERYPEENRNPQYEALMNDISGTKVPLDFSWEGEDAQIALPMTRWNEQLALRMEAKPNPATTSIGGTQPSVPGSWFAGDVGSLMGFEGFAWQFWLVRTFGALLANKAAYVGNGLLPGRHYNQCLIWSPETEESGTAPMKRLFMLYAWPLYVPALRKFVLYDQNYTGISSSLIV